MRGSALLTLLTNFSDEPADRFVDVIPSRQAENPTTVVAEAALPQSPFVRWNEELKAIDVEALVAVAREEERSAARAELEERLAAQADENRTVAAQALEQARTRWTSEQAIAISRGLVEAVSEMEQRLGGQVDKILAPFLGNAARAACLEAFRAGVAGMIAASPQGTLRLRGPQDLVEAIGAHLTARGVPNVCEPSHAIELTAILGDTVMETCLQAFAASLGVALAPVGPAPAGGRHDTIVQAGALEPAAKKSAAARPGVRRNQRASPTGNGLSNTDLS